MNEDKKTMEQILNGLEGKESRQVFMEKFFINGSKSGSVTSRASLLPEQYIDEFFEIELPDRIADGAGNERIKKLRCAMAAVAELYGRHEKAAHFYKAAGWLFEAIGQAKLAGLDRLVDEWSDKYCDLNDKRQSAFNASRLGLTEKAQRYMRECLDENSSKIEIDPEFCIEMASCAASYGLNKESEDLYRKAMKMYELQGDYDSALEVAKTLKDDEKKAFYSSARWLVADVFERGEIQRKESVKRDKND